MSDILKLARSVRVLTIEWPDGKKKDYEVDVSSRDRLTKWFSEEQKLGDLKKYTEGKEVTVESFDEIFDTSRDLISTLVGEKACADIMKRSGGSLINLIAIIAKMGNMANAALIEAQSVVESVTAKR
jgi:hypothetical protein